MRWDFNYLTKVERRGMLILLVSFLLYACIRYSVFNHDANKEDQPNKELIDIIERLEIDKKIGVKESEELQNVNREAANPNTASEQELIAIGMSPYAAKSLINYRSSGFQFRDLDGVKKVYGVDANMLESIRPYLKFDAPSSPPQKRNPVDKTVLPKTIVDPNHATKAQLLAIGFSNYAANSLIAYRNTGATFNNAEDVLEVYGMDEDMFTEVEPYLEFPVIEAVIATIDSSTTITTMTEVLSSFDPNTADYNELMKQGFSSKVANTIIKFRKDKRPFKQADDLLKVYGISDSLLAIISDRILIEEVIAITETPRDSILRNIDLCTATAEQLIEVKGIGPYLSKAIVEYRDKLGGFHSIEQLREVPYLKEEQYKMIKGNFIISGKIKQLIPAELEFNELLKHPYTDFESTKLLFNIKAIDYEERLDEIIKKGMVDSRLIPYLLAD